MHASALLSGHRISTRMDAISLFLNSHMAHFVRYPRQHRKLILTLCCHKG